MKKDDKAKPLGPQPWRPYTGTSWPYHYDRPDPRSEPIVTKEAWPDPKVFTDKVFAKCCDVTRPGISGGTKVGTTVMPASVFGKVMMAGSMPLKLPSAPITRWAT